MTDKSLSAFIGMFAVATLLVLAPQRSAAQSLSSQLSDRDISVSEFNGLEVSDDFEVTLSRGAYGVHLTVDKELAPYVDVYVRSKVLSISYDEKAVPSEIKKRYKGKGAITPIFRVTVYTPELRSVSLTDNVTLIGAEEFVSSQFELTATGKTEIRNLMVNAETTRIDLKKNAVATMSVRAERGAEISTDNNANLKLTFSGKELAVNAGGSSVLLCEGPSSTVNVFAAGSSQVSVTSDTEKVNLTTEGSSKVILTGKAEELSVTGSRSSSVDAFSMPVAQVSATLSNSSNVTVTVSDLVSASLVGGSALYYSGTPEFKIDKIVKSTLAPFGTK